MTKYSLFQTTDNFEFHDMIQCEEDFLNCVDNEKACPYIEDLIAQKEPLTKVCVFLNSYYFSK